MLGGQAFDLAHVRIRLTDTVTAAFIVAAWPAGGTGDGAAAGCSCGVRMVGFMIVAAAVGISAALVKVLMPLLHRVALARPNDRSSHTAPTPQGGGLAVMLATLAVALTALTFAAARDRMPQTTASVAWDWSGASLFLALASLAAVGLADDIWQLGVRIRLAIQWLAALFIIAALPPAVEVLPWLPRIVTNLLLLIGLIWFVNLTNFMDGIDGMTIAEMVPVLTGAVLLLYQDQAMSGRPLAGIDVPALALLGGLLGFAPYNRHVAKVFLGDVGSLPIGGLAGWLLIILAGRGHLAAALILPFYYLADATITLVRRYRRGEDVSSAHRSHAYQLATQRGFPVPEVTGRIWALNGVLMLLALMTVRWPGWGVSLFALALAAAATGFVLLHFERGRS
jgi:UDP-N-acetylmuramyl pentapeptide phosphotransferase/UDP-N-acetylglucosamine-1-phosphate transferase